MIVLSFDIEEFDMPFEYGKSISFEDQMSISVEGTSLILDLLEKHQVKATFFSTVIFAINAPEIIKRIIKDGHEIASHSYYHSDFKVEHLLESKVKLEEITNTKVIGFRMPRMQPVDEKDLPVKLPNVKKYQPSRIADLLKITLITIKADAPSPG
jgi:hypothetical protein